MNSKQIFLCGALLWLFAVGGTTLVALTNEVTQENILANERLELLRNLNALLSVDKFDNDIETDTRQLQASTLLGNDGPSNVYRARKAGKPVAAIFNSVAPNGYNGKIHLLIGIYLDGKIAGVRVVKHAETPGLGDGVEIKKSPWIKSFEQKTLSKPAINRWLVKKDGGDFDQFTGATITPRAIVAAVKNTLLYYQQNADIIFKHE